MTRTASGDYDAIIVGAGLGGLYQLYRLVEAGLKVMTIERGSDVGGVWYWNRYPGARLDSESYSYAYSFSDELRQEWNWSEHFAGQPELLRYFRYVADRFDLRRHIRFGLTVTHARFDEADGFWHVTTDDGATFRTRYFITALGPLSTPTYPNIPGRETFTGDSYHSTNWPLAPVDLSDKRVGIIGTGATGVQIIQEISKVAKDLVVFQRTAHYCAPLNNAPVSETEQADLKRRGRDISATCKSNNSWFLHDADPRSVFDLTDEEREAFLEELYARKGLAIWKGNFIDVGTNARANEVVSDFIRRKTRARIDDPQTADKLVPQGYGFTTRRVPMETGYYEAYNRPNVRLVSLPDTPIEEIMPNGIRTSNEEFDRTPPARAV